MVAMVAIGTIIVLADVGRAIVIVDNATGVLGAADTANKGPSLLELLPPALCATAAMAYALSRHRAMSDLG
jgi:hypothetical protein